MAIRLPHLLKMPSGLLLNNLEMSSNQEILVCIRGKAAYLLTLGADVPAIAAMYTVENADEELL